jgi:enoyl-CoA hydratase
MAVVEVETRGEVAIVTLARPEKLNAITTEMLDGLLEAVEAIGRSETIGAAVLTGRGRAFSAGGDIAAMDSMDEAAFAATIARYMRVSAAFRACPRPIVAAVHGYALAGGFELALMCDVRFAARGTRFGLPDTPLGLSPTSGMTWLLPRIVGLGRAMYLTLGAEDIDAEEAARIGLVDRVTEPDALLAEAEAFAARIASYPRTGVEWTKIGFGRALENDFVAATRDEEAAELACFRSPDTRARLRAFVDRKRT